MWVVVVVVGRHDVANNYYHAAKIMSYRTHNWSRRNYLASLPSSQPMRTYCSSTRYHFLSVKNLSINFSKKNFITTNLEE